MDQSPDHPRSPGEDHREYIIHELQASLTVIKGQAQLLQRWVRRSTIPDQEVVLARLAVIDAMVNRLVEKTTALGHDEDAPDAPA
jgi:nitrogen-specific signal transduction histidine kinase